jgi:D-3-phosphoglycerate dehydrogenase / 2-oxoglutarate reductase
MPLIIVSGNIHADGMAVLRARDDVTVREMAGEDPAEFVARLGGADALLIRTALLPREALVNARRLKVVSRHGVGYDNVPVDALTAKGIPLAVVGGIHSGTVAEHAMFLILALAKAGVRNDYAVRTGDWNPARARLEAFELAGRTLLLIGFGRIGKALAKRAVAFEMKVMAHDPIVTAADMAAAGVVKVDDWRAALAQADVVSLHVPRLKETENMIGAPELALMKPTALIVNTARGGLIDEAALADALRAGRIGGAGIDTFDEEPPRADNPLLGLDRTILSPHVAGLTQEAMARLSIAAAENVLAGLDGRLDPALVVNAEVLRR